MDDIVDQMVQQIQAVVEEVRLLQVLMLQQKGEAQEVQVQDYMRVLDQMENGGGR